MSGECSKTLKMLTTAANGHKSGECLQLQQVLTCLRNFRNTKNTHKCCEYFPGCVVSIFPLCCEHLPVLGVLGTFPTAVSICECCKHFTVLWAFPSSVSICQHFSVLWIIINVVSIFQCCDEHSQMLWVVNVINVASSYVLLCAVKSWFVPGVL